MSLTTETLTPYQQLLRLPENLVGEVIDGRLYTQPRPAGPHAMAGSALGSELFVPFQKGRGGPGGWWIIDEPELHFVRDTEVVVPDIAGWRQERMPEIPEDHRFEVVPDWVCEILSPATAKKDRIHKMPLYARYGVAYAWLVDPLARTLEAFARHSAGHWLLIGAFQDDDLISTAPFEAITLALAELWAPTSLRP
jgi:Uma2 family endonuclease